MYVHMIHVYICAGILSKGLSQKELTNPTERSAIFNAKRKHTADKKQMKM